MKKEILESYDELIKECKVKIKENKDIEVNKSMLQVYSKITEEVKGRKDEYYYGMKTHPPTILLCKTLEVGVSARVTYSVTA